MKTNSTTIYTIRHGQTDFNAEKRYAGRLDIPLNDKGCRDAQLASEALARLEIDFDLVITSSLNRSIQTARILAKQSEVVQSALCDERDYGKMQGLNSEQVRLMEPPIHFLRVGEDEHSLNPPDGETFEMLRNRSELFRAFLFDNFSGKRALVVSHGSFFSNFTVCYWVKIT